MTAGNPRIGYISRMSSASTHLTKPLSITQVLVCGAAVVTLSMGTRHAFGLWLQPVTQAQGWTRETFALAIAIQNLTWGIAGIFSGMVAAHLYSRIAEDGIPKTFIILGPNHTGRGSGLAVTTEDFETPLGIAKVDRELAKAIRKDLVDEDAEAHRGEHSIEVQLPFLQYLSPNVSFVPICMGFQDYEAAVSVGKTIRDAAKDKDVVVIASTDMSH